MASGKTTAREVSLERVRAHWWRRQGLDGTTKGSLGDLIARTGWLRTLGGAEVYLAARARRPGLARTDLDEAAEALDVQVVPAVRGCIYLLPRAHVPVALRFAEAMWRPRAEKEIAQCGAKWKEVEQVAARVLAALDEPLGTDALRKALGGGTVRSFGERGKKVGLSSPLPVALRLLEFRGDITRTVLAGRLDTERYVWCRRPSNLFAGGPRLPADLTTAIATIFFAQMGASTARQFAEWSGLTLAAARAPLAKMPLVPVAVPGWSEPALVPEADLPELEDGDAAGVALLGFEDNLTTVHGGPAVLTDSAHHDRTVATWGGPKQTTLGAAKHLAHRVLVVGGRLVAFWEWDVAARGVVVAPFAPLQAQTRRVVDEAVRDVARLVGEIGHARAYSLDTDATVQERARELRAARDKKKG